MNGNSERWGYRKINENECCHGDSLPCNNKPMTTIFFHLFDNQEDENI